MKQQINSLKQLDDELIVYIMVYLLKMILPKGKQMNEQTCPWTIKSIQL